MSSVQIPLPRGVQLGLFAPAGHDHVRLYPINAIFDEISACPRCGSHEIYVQREPYVRGKSCSRLAAYCVRGHFVGWVNKTEKARLSAQQQHEQA